MGETVAESVARDRQYQQDWDSAGYGWAIVAAVILVAAWMGRR